MKILIWNTFVDIRRILLNAKYFDISEAEIKIYRTHEWGTFSYIRTFDASNGALPGAYWLVGRDGGGELPDSISCTSSNVFPLVSGTKNNTNAVPKMLQTVKHQNVGPIPTAPFNNGNSFVTRKTHSQFTRVANEQAAPLIFDGKISAISIHGIGPNPNEKIMMNVDMLTRGTHPMLETSALTLSFR